MVQEGKQGTREPGFYGDKIRRLNVGSEERVFSILMVNSRGTRSTDWPF